MLQINYCDRSVVAANTRTCMFFLISCQCVVSIRVQNIMHMTTTVADRLA